MNYILDILGSTLIGGIILLLILKMTGSLNGTLINQNMNNTSQTNLTATSLVLERDLRRIGLGVSDSIKIITADTSKITFKLDLGNNGTVDSISYYLSSTSALNATPNPKDRYLYRVINNQTASGINLGITKFRVWYYDKNGSQTSVRSQIKYLKIALTDESVYAYDTTYTGAYLEKIIKPKNL